MWKESITDKQRQLLLTAMTAPLLQTASGCSWLVVLVAGVIAMAACFCVEVLSGKTEPSKWNLWFRRIGIILVMSRILGWTTGCWQDERSTWGVPLTLLAMAFWASRGGSGRVIRTAGVIRVFLLLIFGSVLLLTVREIKPENLAPVWRIEDEDLFVVLLIPALSYQVRGERIRTKFCMILIAVAASVLTVGALTLSCTDNSASPFYELSRSLSLFGVVKRLESLASVGLTMGYFVLLCYLLLALQWTDTGMLAASIASMALYCFADFKIPFFITAVAAVAWVILPGITAVDKKLKKYEKST